MAVPVATLCCMPDDSVPVVFEHVWMQGPRFTDGALPLSAVDELTTST